jgi:hypothetical protein
MLVNSPGQRICGPPLPTHGSSFAIATSVVVALMVVKPF